MNEQQGQWPQQGNVPMGPGGQTPSREELQWAMIAHLGTLVAWFWAPLILMLVDIGGQPSAFVKHHAKQSLIFCCVGMVATILTCGIAAIPMLIFQVIAGLEANKGVWYTYPGLGSFV